MPRNNKKIHVESCILKLVFHLENLFESIVSIKLGLKGVSVSSLKGVFPVVDSEKAIFFFKSSLSRPWATLTNRFVS